MTDDVIAMAHESGTIFVTKVGVASATTEWLERFAALVAEREREACAKVCDEESFGALLFKAACGRDGQPLYNHESLDCVAQALSECATAMRARSLDKGGV